MYKSIYKKNWITIKLEEDLRLSDFKAHAGISDFTKRWKDKRQSIKGAANKSARLVRMKVNKDKDYVTFIFYSAPTYDFTSQTTNPDKSFEISGKHPFYIQEIKILDFFKWLDTIPSINERKVINDDIKEVLKNASIQVYCNDPSFHWQGDNYIVSQFDASIYPTNIAPKHWNQFHNDDNFLCKHLSMIFSQIEFFLNLMASMLNKYLNK